MILTHLRLVNFRSYSKLDLSLTSGTTAIVGENAVGKTNLVEAIQFLSLARSFRTNEDSLLIRSGESAAFVEATLEEGSLRRNVAIELGREGKKAYLNGKPIRRLSELSRLANVICFSPKDVSLLSDSPSERRSFLDVSLSKQSIDYFRLISDYGQLLKKRNALLKEVSPDKMLLEVLTEQMIRVEEPLVRYRALYCDSLTQNLPGLLRRLRGDECDSSIVYKPFVRLDGDFASNAKKAYSTSLESDLIHRSTMIGPHREDFSVRVNGKDVSDYGSQGENRMAVLALKLCPYYLIEDSAKKPIVVLDDVTSELDANRAENLFGVLNDFTQTFVTGTNLKIEGASYVDVALDRAIRRN